MWVVESGGSLRFSAESRLERLVGRHIRRQHLESDYSVGSGVVGPVDLTHSPSAYQLLQLIVPEWCRIHRQLLGKRAPASRVDRNYITFARKS